MDRVSGLLGEPGLPMHALDLVMHCLHLLGGDSTERTKLGAAQPSSADNTVIAARALRAPEKTYNKQQRTTVVMS